MRNLQYMAARIVSAARIVGSAARVAGAVESGGAPNVRDLERLGISAESFAAIGRT